VKEQDAIKELFSEKLGNYQAPVNPNVWANISAQMATSTTATATGLSIAAKTLIGLGIAAVATVAVVAVTYTPSTAKEERQESKAKVSTTNEAIASPELKTESEERTSHDKPENNVRQPEPKGDIFVVEASDINAINESGNTEHKIIDTEEENEFNQKLLQSEKEEGRASVEENDYEEREDVVEDVKETSSVVAIEETELDRVKINLFNVFTPNGDMNNDFLYVESEDLTDFNVVVLNNKNEVVFQSNDQSFKWYGNGMNGSPVPAGNYVYFVTAVDKNGNPVNEHSSLSILR
jgi:gliding motility-associated-like protein